MLHKFLYRLRFRVIYFYHHRLKKYSLEDHLIKINKSCWLDIGSSSNNSSLNFDFCDLYPVSECIPEFKGKYFQIDITKTINKENTHKKYDLIRMQHVFEHFTFEEADVVLKNCSRLLKKNGLLLITVPDLDLMVNLYRKNLFSENTKFYNWAIKRIKPNSSSSDFFSIFTHSHLHQEHKWCYDKKGLINKIKSSKEFKNIQKISLFHKYCNIPFTHNRPEEDLCVISQKK